MIVFHFYFFYNFIFPEFILNLVFFCVGNVKERFWGKRQPQIHWGWGRNSAQKIYKQEKTL